MFKTIQIFFRYLCQFFSFTPTQKPLIALYVDCENISNVGYFQMAIDELEKIGTLHFKCFYGDFEEQHKTLLSFITQQKAQMIHLPKIKYKNYADIKMTVDIMDMIHQNPQITHIAIMSNDNDFDPVIWRIRKAERLSIGLITRKNLIHLSFDILIDLDNPTDSTEDQDTQKIIYALNRYQDQEGWVEYAHLLGILKTFSTKKDWHNICQKRIQQDNRFIARTNLAGELMALRLNGVCSDEEDKYIIRKVIQNHNKKHAKAPQDYVTLKRVRGELKKLGYIHLNDIDAIKAIIHAHPQEFLFEKSGNWVKLLV